MPPLLLRNYNRGYVIPKGIPNHALNLNHSNLSSGAFHNNMIASKSNIPNEYMSIGQQSMYTTRETSLMSFRSGRNSRMQFQNSYCQSQVNCQESDYNERCRSAMSLRSLPNSRMQSQNSYYPSQVNCQQSHYNERCTSPMSSRSIGSHTSVSAGNIVLAIKNSYLSRNELRKIKDACNSLMSSRSRRKIGKRRHLKSILKYCSRKSGGESGVEGSDSSCSSDDCRSSRSTFYKENLSIKKTRPLLADSNKFTQNSVSDIYDDRSENFKQNSLRNLLTANNRIGNHKSMHNGRQIYSTHDKNFQTYNDKHSEINEKGLHINITEKSKNGSEKDRPIVNAPHITNNKIQNVSVATLKERFTESSFPLPSQRFGKPAAHSTTYEMSKKNHPKDSSDKSKTSNNICETTTNKQIELAIESDNENYDILLQNAGIESTIQSDSRHRKRILETDDILYPGNKKNKLTPRIRNDTASSEIIELYNSDEDDYNFKKPLPPTRKAYFLKRSLNTDSEVLIAKSSQPLVGVVSKETKNITQTRINVDKTNNGQERNKLSETAIDTANDISVTEITQNSSNTSKPSFIKRKLFTQNLDIVESNNLSDHINGNSPQLKTIRACTEKNRVRKLVSSQACLSRDVFGDNNMIDLIHKIVPAYQINVKNALNKQEAFKSTHEDKDKWDVTSVISKCQIDDMSDTYSDEEIFNLQQGNTKNTNGHKDNTKEAEKLKYSITEESSAKQTTESSFNKNKYTDLQCKVVMKKLSNMEVRVQTKQKKVGLVKSFWDTDLSDLDSPLKIKSREEQRPKKAGLVKSFGKTNSSYVNDNIDSQLIMKSQEVQRSKKVGLAKSFWDTDLSDVESSAEFPKNTKSQEERTQVYYLRNTTKIMSVSCNGTRSNINTENSLNKTVNSNTKRRKSTDNKNISTRISRSRSKNKKTDLDVQSSKNSKKDEKSVNKEKIFQSNNKPSSNKKEKEASPNSLNSPRQSLRIQQKKDKKNKMDETISSDNCNRSRQSLRLEIKRQHKSNYRVI